MTAQSDGPNLTGRSLAARRAGFYICLLLVAVHIDVGLRYRGVSDSFLWFISYSSAFLGCAVLWGVACVMLRKPLDARARGIVVGIAIITAVVDVSDLGILLLLLNAFVLTAVALEAVD